MDTCDFFLNLLSTGIGAGIGVIGAFSIYQKQIHNNDLNKRLERLTEEKDYLKYYLNLVTDFIGTARFKLSCLEEYTVEQKQCFPDIISMKDVSDNTFFKVRNCDNSLLFRAWMDHLDATANNKMAEFDKLRVNLDYIEGVFDNINSSYKQHGSKNFEALTGMHNVFIEFCDNLTFFLIDLESKMGGKIPEDSDERILLKYLAEHKRKTENEKERLKYRFNEARQTLIEPIQSIMKKHIFDYPPQITAPFRKILYDLDTMKKQTDCFIADLEKYKEPIDKALKNIEEISQKIKLI